VSSKLSPNFVEPLENDSVKYDTDDEIINCCAVMFPATFKFPKKVPLPVTAKLSLMFKEPVILDEPVMLAPPRSTTRPFFTLN
jgi:hypothetical protein